MGSKSKSSSSSSTKTFTETNNLDNRVAAAEEGVALGQGATLNITDNFNEGVQEAFQAILNTAENAVGASLELVEKSVSKNQETTNNALASITQSVSQQNLGSATILKDVVPLIGLAVAGGVGFLIIGMFKK